MAGNPLSAEPPVHRRFMPDQRGQYAHRVEAAKQFVARLGNPSILDQMPVDPRKPLSAFFGNMYQALNLLEALNLPPSARVLEVGAGSGWVTEILVRLGYTVTVLEPSEAMLDICRRRVAGCIAHHRIPRPPHVDFHCATIEEFELADGRFDAVLFYRSLHHVVDEERALRNTFRALRPGGVLGVGGDSNWIPGNREQKEFWDEEIRKFAAVESPFTYEYLHYLLRRHGFRGIVRHHNVNGMFPVSVEQTPLRDAAHGSAVSLNSITALKPEWAGQDTEDPSAPTSAAIDILQADIDRNRRQARLRVRLTNNGAASWLHRGDSAGFVVLTLFCREPGGIIAEAVPRARLPHEVVPGATCVIEAVFDISKGSEAADWHVDLINEGHYWFHERGGIPARLRGV